MMICIKNLTLPLRKNLVGLPKESSSWLHGPKHLFQSLGFGAYPFNTYKICKKNCIIFNITILLIK